MKKPAIPATGGLPRELSQILEPIKANVELITGARPGSVSLDVLNSSASLSDVITKVNQILSRINQSG
jgi:hypothetical protein